MVFFLSPHSWWYKQLSWVITLTYFPAIHQLAKFIFLSTACYIQELNKITPPYVENTRSWLPPRKLMTVIAFANIFTNHFQESYKTTHLYCNIWSLWKKQNFTKKPLVFFMVTSNNWVYAKEWYDEGHKWWSAEFCVGPKGRLIMLTGYKGSKRLCIFNALHCEDWL